MGQKLPDRDRITAWVYLVPSSDQKKLDNHTQDFYFLGVLPNGNGVKVIDAKTRKLIQFCDVFFNKYENLSIKSSIHQHETNKSSEPNPPWVFPEGNQSPQELEDEIQSCEEDIPPPPKQNTPVQRPRCQLVKPAWYGNLRAHSENVNNAPTYKMAINSNEKESWTAAMKHGIDSFIEQKVFSLVPKPKTRKII